MRKSLIALAILALSAPALAQPVTQSTLTGSECWSVGQGPGGPSAFVCMNLTRNSFSNVVTTIAGNITIGTGATAALALGGHLLVTAQPAVATITLPASPFPDGNIIGICNTSASAWSTNAVTVAGNTGQTSPVGATATLTTLSAGNCARYQYNLALLSWYRVQ